MSEEVKPKKKSPRFGITWLVVCALAIALAVLLACVGPLGGLMDDYNNHSHSFECFSKGWDNPNCSYSYCDNALFYALEFGAESILQYTMAALVIANLIMVIWWALRKEEVRPTLFGRVWFISLVVVRLFSPIAYLCYMLFSVPSVLWPLWRFLAGYTDVTPTILTYIVLTIGWVIGRKKWNFHGKWVGFSYLAYLASFLIGRFVTVPLYGGVLSLVIPVLTSCLPIVVVWIAYVVLPKKQKPMEQQPEPLSAQPVYYSPAAYLGVQAPTTETADGDAAIPVEQLHQLQALLESGVITQEEFDAKKKQLLGL